jgi:hypothetical protein
VSLESADRPDPALLIPLPISVAAPVDVLILTRASSSSLQP